jgi:hypothetical protein
VAPALLAETGGPAVNLGLVALLGAGLALTAGGLLLRTRKNEIVA